MAEAKIGHVEHDNERTCKKYCKYRQDQDVNRCLELLSKNAIITDKDGNKHTGQDEIREYLTNSYVSATYTEPERVKDNLYTVQITAYWVITKTAYFYFNSKGKIKSIKIE